MDISLDDLKKLELTATDLRQEIDPEQSLTAIFKVKKRNYVPQGVELHSRVDSRIFTGSFTARELTAIESDNNVVSIAISKPLRLID